MPVPLLEAEVLTSMIFPSHMFVSFLDRCSIVARSWLGRKSTWGVGSRLMNSLREHITRDIEILAQLTDHANENTLLSLSFDRVVTSWWLNPRSFVAQSAVKLFHWSEITFLFFVFLLNCFIPPVSIKPECVSRLITLKIAWPTNVCND